ncbi:MAG: heavy metal-binding domain-containing protein [Thermoanaerobaculia bacterium]|nr:heavy metal-binding domain-containing protein [Thermoanaerobaculia bacterium]
MSTNALSSRGRFALACAFLITFGSPLAARHDHSAASPAAPEAAQAPAKAELAPEAPAASGCCAMAAAAPAAKSEGGHDCCAKCAHCSAPGATSCCAGHDSKAEAGHAHAAHGAHAGHAGHGAGHPHPGAAKAEGAGCCAMAGGHDKAEDACCQGGPDCCADCEHCQKAAGGGCCAKHEGKGCAMGDHGSCCGDCPHCAQAKAAKAAGCCGESCTAGCCGEAGCNAPEEGKAAAFSCPMHPEVTATEAGAKCSECGMKLVAPAGGTNSR